MLMSVMPYFICTAVLILMAYREREHARIVRGLIDKILIQRGLEPLPEVVKEPEVVEEPKPVEKPDRIRVPIPGMAAFQAMAQRYSKARVK